MSALVPRLFGDLTDWFEMDFPVRSGQMIRIEDNVTDNEYLLRAELPGMQPDKDIQVTAHDGVLSIRAERKEQENTRQRTEFRYGMLQRSVRLPAGADTEHVKAVYRDGILQVAVPLNVAAPAEHKIPISS